MPLLLDTAPTGSAVELRSGNCLTLGLVNNMPDAAVEATERQFVALIRAAATDTVVRLKLFAMGEVPRGARMRAQLAGRYRDVAELWDTRLDGLIVTGTEPRAENLKDEPYWAPLTQIVDWARKNTASTIWSCLAAHAAVLHADGIERRRLTEKQFGVFACAAVGAHPLTKGAAPRLRVPHSRYNDLPEPALADCGYKLLTRSAAAGVDMFTREQSFCSLFLFLQGHPEYEAGTLLREYRRDIARFLRGEREHYPAVPQGYFNTAATDLANAFRARAGGDRRDRRDRPDDLIADFPMAALAAGLESSWRRSAIGLYQRWIADLKERKTQLRTPFVPLRPSWRDGPGAVAAHPSRPALRAGTAE